MGRSSLPGSLNPRQMCRCAEVWKMLRPLIAIPALVAGPSLRWTSATGVRGNEASIRPTGSSVAIVTCAEVRVVMVDLTPRGPDPHRYEYQRDGSSGRSPTSERIADDLRSVQHGGP
jgi:hypothetical protein